MSDLVLYGNYYKMFNGNSGIPEKITVVEIKGDSVTLSEDIILKRILQKEEIQ